MRRLLAAMACAGIIVSAQAQRVEPATVLTPSPYGIVLAVGQWLYTGSDRVYYIQVVGQGATAEESRLNGFRLAVEQAVGSVIASETETRNSRLVRNEIISYASGYVSRFEIVQQQNTAQGVSTTMRVWIKRNGIANRLLHTGNSAVEINGSQAAVAVATLQHERSQGDRLVNSVINDFYRQGMRIQATAPTVSFDNNRQAVLTVPYQLEWNQDYLESLWQALRATSQGTPTTETMPRISMPRGFMRSFGRTVGFTDSHRIDQILDTMVSTRPTIHMTLTSRSGATVLTGCYRLDQLDHATGFDTQGAEYFLDSKYSSARNVVFNTTLEVKRNITVPVTPEQLSKIDQVHLKIVPRTQCLR